MPRRDGEVFRFGTAMVGLQQSHAGRPWSGGSRSAGRGAYRGSSGRRTERHAGGVAPPASIEGARPSGVGARGVNFPPALHRRGPGRGAPGGGGGARERNAPPGRRGGGGGGGAGRGGGWGGPPPPRPPPGAGRARAVCRRAGRAPASMPNSPFGPHSATLR